MLVDAGGCLEAVGGDHASRPESEPGAVRMEASAFSLDVCPADGCRARVSQSLPAYARSIAAMSILPIFSIAFIARLLAAVE